MQDSGSKVSNVEWGLVIGALFVMDGIQWFLDFIAIGLAVNPFIDLSVAMTFGFWLIIRGEMDMWRFGGWLVAVLGDGLSDGVIPLWGLEGIYSMVMSKAKQKLSEIPGGDVVAKAVGKNTKP